MMRVLKADVYRRFNFLGGKYNYEGGIVFYGGQGVIVLAFANSLGCGDDRLFRPVPIAEFPAEAVSRFTGERDIRLPRSNGEHRELLSGKFPVIDQEDALWQRRIDREFAIGHVHT